MTLDIGAGLALATGIREVLGLLLFLVEDCWPLPFEVNCNMAGS